MDKVIEKVKSIFEADGTVAALIPKLRYERTGDSIPYAVLDNIDDPVETRSNQNKYHRMTFQIHLWGTTQDLVLSYRNAVKDALDDVDLGLTITDGVSLFCRVINNSCLQEDKELWQWVLFFEVLYTEAK